MERPTVDEIVSAAREFLEADDRVAELGWTRETEEAFDAAKTRLAGAVADFGRPPAEAKNEVEGDLHEKCLTAGDLRRALERLPDGCLVNTVDDSTVVGECVHVRHGKGSDYVDVGVVGNDRARGE